MIICISDVDTIVLESGEPDFYVDADIFTSLLKDREKALAVYEYFNRQKDMKKAVLIGYLGHEEETGVYSERYRKVQVNDIIITDTRRLNFYEKL